MWKKNFEVKSLHYEQRLKWMRECKVLIGMNTMSFGTMLKSIGGQIGKTLSLRVLIGGDPWKIPISRDSICALIRVEEVFLLVWKYNWIIWLFLTGPCRGELLSTIGKDGDNHMYYVAWTVVEMDVDIIFK